VCEVQYSPDGNRNHLRAVSTHGRGPGLLVFLGCRLVGPVAEVDEEEQQGEVEARVEHHRARPRARLPALHPALDRLDVPKGH